MAGKMTMLGAAMLFSMLAALCAYTLSDRYIDRLPNHHGYYLVPVVNQVHSQPKKRPRHSILVLVDGLRRSDALTMSSLARLRAAGQCRSTYSGALTISRPVYTVISSGVEADRTGARNNDETRPVRVESIWQVARRAGLQVRAVSNLNWWQELFPDAFDDYRREANEELALFGSIELGDLNLIHPVRVDTAGHDHGADSRPYRDAVATTDRELAAFLDTLDLREDLIIVTADHGHSDTGGHGGPGKQISEVLTCFAGPGIRHEGATSVIDARMIAPTLSVLLGLPFPKHMRAGQDSLDQIWRVVDSAAIGESYANERRQDIEDFRRANAVQLGAWLGKATGTWSELYQRDKRRQCMWWLALAVLAGTLLALSFRARGYGVQRALASVLWMLASIAATCVLYTFVRHSFDFTSINKRQEFIRASLAVCLSTSMLALVLHGALWRDLRGLLCDQLSLLALLLIAALAHLWIYGDPLGFPLPGPHAIFLPFLQGAVIICAGMCASLLAAISMAQQWLRR